MSTTTTLNSGSPLSVYLPILQTKPYTIPGKLSHYLNTTALFLSASLWKTSDWLLSSFVVPITPGEFNQSRSKLLEIAMRTLKIACSCLALPFTLSMGLISSLLCRPLLNKLSSQPYMHLKSNASSANPNTYKMLTLNACMLPGCIPAFCDGLPSDDTRIPSLLKLIKTHAPDIIALSEMNPHAAQSVFSSLKKEYSHCFLDMGKRVTSLDNNLCIISKVPILNHDYVQFPNTTGIIRGVFIFETSKAIFFFSHLQNGDDAPETSGIQPSEKRSAQLDLIKELMLSTGSQYHKPCFLMGDLNIRRDNTSDEYSSKNILQTFKDPYFEKHPFLNSYSATCASTSHLLSNRKLGKKEILDYVLLHLDGTNSQISGFSTERLLTHFTNKKRAETISDHHALISQIEFSS